MDANLRKQCFLFASIRVIRGQVLFLTYAIVISFAK